MVWMLDRKHREVTGTFGSATKNKSASSTGSTAVGVDSKREHPTDAKVEQAKGYQKFVARNVMAGSR